MNLRMLCVPLLVLMSHQATAADIAREVVTSAGSSDGYAEIRLSLGGAKIPLIGFNDKRSIETSDERINFIDLSLDARFRYKAFFIDFVADSFSNIALGFTIANSDSGSLEILATNVFNDIDRKEIAGLESIIERENDANLGVRSSIYRGDNTFQIELMRDVSDTHDGVIGALHYGRQKQVRNWNLHALFGVRYFSDRVIDYYFGVSADESTAAIPVYNAKAGILPSIQIGATIPLSEKWLFKTQAEYLQLPDSVVDSPLAQGDAIYSAQIGISYVFGG